MDPAITPHLKKKRRKVGRIEEFSVTTDGEGHVELSALYLMGISTLFLVLCTVDSNYFFNQKMKKICIVNLLSYFQKGEWGTFLCEMERAKKKKKKKKLQLKSGVYDNSGANRKVVIYALL